MNTKYTLIILGLMFIMGTVLYSSGWSFSSVPHVVSNLTAYASSTTQENTSGAVRSDTNIDANVGNTANTPKVPVQTALTDATLMAVINNSLIRAPQTGIDVALVGGSANFVDGSVKGRVTIDNLLNRVQTDDGVDVFVGMSVVVDGDPSVMKYIALFNNKGQSVVFKSSVLVGDRILVTNLVPVKDSSVISKPLPYMTSLGYTAVVSYLDRKNGEPFSTIPSLVKTVSLRVTSHVVSK